MRVSSEGNGGRRRGGRTVRATGAQPLPAAGGSRSQPPAGAKGEPCPGGTCASSPAGAELPAQPRGDRPGLPAYGALSDPRVWKQPREGMLKKMY